MSLLQALAYFLREAAVSLRRSWKVSLLAVVTIAVSLYVGGGFLLLGSGLARQVERWRDEAKVVVYLERSAPPGELAAVAAAARSAGWAAAVDEVPPAVAASRFRRTFPGLADLVSETPPSEAQVVRPGTEGRETEVSGAEGPGTEGPGVEGPGVEGPGTGRPDAETGSPLPASVEITPRVGTDPAPIAAWASVMERRPGVDTVDDDREWLEQLDAVLAVVRGVGFTLGAILLGAAIFTIASVIRLTAYLYHEEIAVMRLVGATEFFIRGPFYAEGTLQGLLGGLLAVAGLAATWRLALPHDEAGVMGRLLAGGISFGPREATSLVLLGAVSGLVGALLSLRREDLGPTADADA